MSMRRLSIIDIQGGHQPMPNKDRSLWIVFNGEIYNAPEIRRRMEQRGEQFLTGHSDTEVLLLGFIRERERLLPRLRGTPVALNVDGIERQRATLAWKTSGLDAGERMFELPETRLDRARILQALNIGDPRHGADLIVQLATGGGLESGGYYAGRSVRRITPVAPADDPVARQQLWQATAELLSARGFKGVYPDGQG